MVVGSLCLPVGRGDAKCLDRVEIQCRSDTPTTRPVGLSSQRVHGLRYGVDRATVGRPLGRPKAIGDRVLADIRTDGINHFPESSGTQRRCGVCGLKTRRICRKCDIGLHQECFVSFHL